MAYRLRVHFVTLESVGDLSINLNNLLFYDHHEYGSNADNVTIMFLLSTLAWLELWARSVLVFTDINDLTSSVITDYYI